MEHLHSRIPYAQWRLRVFRQLFLPSVASNATFLSRRIHSDSNNVVHHQNIDTTTTAASNDNQQNTVNDNDTAEPPTRPSLLLPQSPLLTNPYPGRALRHRKKRPPTPDDLADLRKNPWAMALASPVRLCAVSGARMPKALLTDWGMVEEPTSALDSNPNHSNSPPESQPGRSSPANDKDKDNNNKLWLLPVTLLQDALVNPTGTGGKRVRPHLQLRMVDRMPILETLTSSVKRSRKQKYPQIAKLVPFRWKHPFGPMTAVEEKCLVWRPDMPEFVLRMMRLEALRRLKRVSDTFKRQDVDNGVWRSIDVQGKRYSEAALLEGLVRMETFERMGSGAVLVLGDGSNTDAEAGVAPALPDTVTLPGLGSKVPVFDLTRLFSQAELEEIRSHHERFQKFAVFLRPADQLTVDAVLALWKLQGYVRESNA